MMPPRTDREIQDAIGKRLQFEQVSDGRQRVNGPVRDSMARRSMLFLVKPGMDVASVGPGRERRWRGVEARVAPDNLIVMKPRVVAEASLGGWRGLLGWWGIL
jgi:hypothetical protein